MVLAELEKFMPGCRVPSLAQGRLERDPMLLDEIRATVDASGLWPATEGTR